MDKFNRNELRNVKITEVRDTKVLDQPRLDLKDTRVEAPVVLEHIEKPILKEEILETNV